MLCMLEIVMLPKNLILCALWIVSMTTVTAYRSESLELMEHCCAYKCGKIDEPLFINSDGLDKKEDQFSELRITSGSKVWDNVDPRESYCMINIYALDYTMLNLTYYVDISQDDNTVVIMDSTRVNPRQNTAEGIDSGADDDDDDQAGGQRETSPSPRHTEGLNVKRLMGKFSKLSNHLNKYEMQNYRITPNRLLTIAVKFEALKQNKVRLFDASFVADKGTAGRTFFIILGVVVVFFVIGVVGSFLVYKRYKRRRRSRQRTQVVRFNRNTNATSYHAGGATSAKTSDRVAPQRSGPANNVLTAPGNTRRRLSLTERIWKATNRKSDMYVPPVLPKHELLQKQEQNSRSERPISVVSPIQQRTEFAFPGIDPENEEDSPPQTVERPLQSSRNRVVSHMVISEEDIYDDTGTPPLVKDSTKH